MAADCHLATWLILRMPSKSEARKLQSTLGLTSLRGLVKMDMASFQPKSTMATIAHKGGSLLLAALFASWVFTACNVI